MPSDVKPTRRYDSRRRREQAAATRRDILEAAQRLFERDGYAAAQIGFNAQFVDTVHGIGTRAREGVAALLYARAVHRDE